MRYRNKILEVFNIFGRVASYDITNGFVYKRRIFRSISDIEFAYLSNKLYKKRLKYFQKYVNAIHYNRVDFGTSKPYY